jgi:hypothetical protein
MTTSSNLPSLPVQRGRQDAYAVRVNVAGNATGMIARTDVNSRGTISLHGIAWVYAYIHIARITRLLKIARLRVSVHGGSY